jgi:hypothetical protein
LNLIKDIYLRLSLNGCRRNKDICTWTESSGYLINVSLDKSSYNSAHCLFYYFKAALQQIYLLDHAIS